MDRYQLESLYMINGLPGLKLKTTNDLLKIHNIDYEKVDGYNKLDDFNRAIYKRFILAFYNSSGLESRLMFEPKGVYSVEDWEFIVKDGSGNCDIVGGETYYIDKYGEKTLLYEWEDSNYQISERFARGPEYFLRFEYKCGTRNEWLRVSEHGKKWC